MNPTDDHAAGCLLGLALGDALGAPYEGGPLERALWALIGKTRSGHLRWTDDTQMSLDLARVLLAAGRVDQDALAARFAASYRWSRGYGPGTARVLKLVAGGRPWRDAVRAVHPSGSFGNGAAMRSPVLGVFYATARRELLAATRAAAAVTHAHPLALEGAVTVAQATADLLLQESTAQVLASAIDRCASEVFDARLRTARSWLESGASPAPREVRSDLGNGMTAQDSAVTAVYLALRFRRREFEELAEFGRRCGGDTDTIGAMAGALWGAANGAAALPTRHLSRLEAREEIHGVARSLWRASQRDRPPEASSTVAPVSPAPCSTSS